MVNRHSFLSALRQRMLLHGTVVMSRGGETKEHWGLGTVHIHWAVLMWTQRGLWRRWTGELPSALAGPEDSQACSLACCLAHGPQHMCAVCL
jgi:hypothetical protein